jgi:hypothetical protein
MVECSSRISTTFAQMMWQIHHILYSMNLQSIRSNPNLSFLTVHARYKTKNFARNSLRKFKTLHQGQDKHSCAGHQYFFKGDFFNFFQYFIQHCFICRPSDFTVSEDAGIGPRTVATLALAKSHPVIFRCSGSNILLTIYFLSFAKRQFIFVCPILCYICREY